MYVSHENSQWPIVTTVMLNAAGHEHVVGTTRENAAKTRLVSLDVYRGLIMLLMISRVVLPSPEKHPDLAFLLAQFDHLDWQGMVLWDLIQPAFLFIVGMAIPFSIANRLDRGIKMSQVFRHVLYRAFILLLLGQILYSIATKQLVFQLINPLVQIAFASVLTFVILQTSLRSQVAAAACLLFGHWMLFLLFPGSEGPFSKDNVGSVMDRAVLGSNYPGHYVLISFIGSTITTLFGAWLGLLLLKRPSHDHALRILAIAAAAAFIGGLAMQPFNPIVKRLWTSSFTLMSSGWIILLFLIIYWLVEVKRLRRLAFPFVIVGMNAIFIYCASTMLQFWMLDSLRIFTGPLHHIGSLAPGVANAILAMFLYWYLCYWLYDKKVFVRI
jgi:predicted acyltransferase